LVACAEPPAEEAIKIGLIVPLGDTTGDHGRKGALLAEEQINDNGGILGRDLEVIVIDDEASPDAGAAAVDQLATVDNVDVFITGAFSGVHMAQIPRFKVYEKVTLCTGAASSLCEQAIGEPAEWYFHLFPWDYMQAQDYYNNWMGLIDAYPAINYTRFFIAYEEGPWGTASYGLTVSLFGNWTEVLGESFKSAAFGGGDYSAVLQHAKDADPSIFVWVGYDADALPIMEQAKAIDFAPPLFAGSPPGWPVNFGNSTESEAVVFYEVWVPSLREESPVAEQFYNDYVAKWGEEPVNVCAPLLYSAVQIVAEGMERAGSTETGALITALEDTEYYSPMMQVITFSPSLIIKHQSELRPNMCQWQNGEQEVVYHPLGRNTSTLIYPFPSWEGR
jgi:branched-chain amino acid transport system substrate-binding protein